MPGNSVRRATVDVVADLLEPLDTRLLPAFTKDHPGSWFAKAFDQIGRLSSGEQTIINTALAIYNGDRTARVAELLLVDVPWQRRIVQALSESIG